MNVPANLSHFAHRIDLAVAFRWAVKLNLHESVANHFSLAVNADGTRFLMNPNGRHFARIKASDLLEIDANDPATMNRPDAPDPTPRRPKRQSFAKGRSCLSPSFLNRADSPICRPSISLRE